MRRIKRLVFTAVGIVVCWLFLTAIGGIIPGSFQRGAVAPERFVHVGLIQGPIHTDFMIPLDEETRQDFAMLDLPDNAEWLAVGWGGHEFYTTVGSYRDVSMRVIARTVFGDQSVMRFQPVGAYLPDRTIMLNGTQYSKLRQIILSDTDFNQPVGADLLVDGDRYFAAHGRFNLINTCNQWISRSLRRAGHSFGFWTQTNWAVRLSLAIYG